MLASTKDDNRNKLALYKLYDFTKGGTDIVDQRMGFHTWPIVVFSYMIDKARVNSATIHALNRKEDPCTFNSFEYIFDLACNL